ncbi:MAG TPA: helix-turn-helix transcriptional regulator [Solirubrobacterales bacterium]|nr:helix-turn-helix transcriptional regulator [Solirubrobacterales bacterium]
MTDEGITFSTVAERFGWNLRIARNREGLTQRELAARLGMEFTCDISVWETGKQCPRIDTVVRLAEALEIEPGELLRETKGLAS